MSESPQKPVVPFFRPEISEEEIASVVDTLRSGWLTSGPKTRQFERDFAEKVGAPHAIAVNSCTSALHLSLDALGISPGDEVLVPTLTFTATAGVVVHCGAKPVLVDCDPDTLNLDLDQLEHHVTPRTKAIMPVHYGGQPCDMDRVMDFAQAHNLFVVEDAAHALPAKWRDRTIGTIGHTTCFSFYANKTITTGEGGMVTTSDDELAERIRLRSLHGLSKNAWKRFSAQGAWYYEVVYPGYKNNLTDMAAALGLGQLARCDDFWSRRQDRVNRYNELLADVAEVQTPVCLPHVQHAWHLYVIQIRPERLTISRNEFIQHLEQAGIVISVHYLPLHMHPYYRESLGYEPDDLPAARAAYDRIISLPLYPSLSDESLEYVADAVRRIAREHRR